MLVTGAGNKIKAQKKNYLIRETISGLIFSRYRAGMKSHWFSVHAIAFKLEQLKSPGHNSVTHISWEQKITWFP